MSQNHKHSVLTLKLSDYKPHARLLPPELKITSAHARLDARSTEERLLRLHFRNWEQVLNGRLPGWREGSSLYLMRGEQLVGGGYLCARNEFRTEDQDWGQLHYFFTDPDFQQIMLYTALLDEAIRRARDWRLEGVFINTRHPKLARRFKRLNAEDVTELYRATAPEPPRRNRLQHLTPRRLLRRLFAKSQRSLR